MYFKVNLKKLDSHSHSIADKIINEFYNINSEINGQQILNLTGFEQINFFILYHIFENWKEAAEKLKSPYFNYENSLVKDSYSKFVNILSQNISIEKDLFRPLLRKAIFETLYWIVAPEELINHLYNNGKLHTVEKVKAYTKYVKINKILMDEFVSILEKQQKEKFPQDELVWHFTKIYEANQIAIYEPLNLLQDFSNVIQVDVTDLLPGAQTKIPITEAILPLPGKIVEEMPISTSQEISKPKTSEMEKSESTIINGQITKTEILEDTEELRISSNTKSHKVEEQKILNNTFNHANPTINDVLKQGDNSLNKKLAKSKVTDIKTAIPLNKKFQFINELFNGESTQYNFALSEVQNSDNYNQAVKLIQDKYATKFNWLIENPCVEEFYEIVERRFL